jgi:hypothetical protein
MIPPRLTTPHFPLPKHCENLTQFSGLGANIMKNITLAFASALLIAPCAPLLAQASPMVVGTSANAPLVLPQGTSVRLRTLSPLNSMESKAGDRFDLEVSEDVLLNGMVIIPRGSAAKGEVTLVKKKGMWGKSGKLETRVLSVRANGRDIPLRGTVNDKGDTGTAGVIGAIVVLPLAGFFVTGTSANLPQGTGYTGITESDIPIAVIASASPSTVNMVPQPISVSVATPSATVAK